MLVLPIMYTSTTMILVRYENKRKVFPSQTFETLYEYAKTDEWEFDNDQIDLTCLHLQNNEIHETENKLVKITKKSEPVTVSLYKVALVYNEDQNIYLPDTYSVLVQNKDATVSKVKVKDLKPEMNVLTKMFGNVTHSLSVLSVESIGDYELNGAYTVDLDQDDIISVGTESVEIYACEE